MNPIPLVIDTDTAGDDTIALLLGLLCPEVDLKAITICAGNISFEQEVENALYTVELAGRGGDVPVYPGCRSPLLKPWETVENIHGTYGMGSAHYPLAQQRPETLHAANALVEMAQQHAGQLVVCGIAPLTNLAVALQLDPELPKKVRKLYLMAGNNQALGNVTPAAEYNVWVDPDAAKIVFGAGFDLTMVGWEICVRHSLMDDATWDEIGSFNTTLSDFFLTVNHTTREFCKRVQHLDGSTHPDALTVAGIVDPELFTRVEPRYVEVETTSPLTRGMTVVDELGVLQQAPNTEVVYEADETRFKALLYRLLQRA